MHRCSLCSSEIMMPVDTVLWVSRDKRTQGPRFIEAVRKSQYLSARGLTPQVKTHRLMDDGYPPEKTPSKERQTCGHQDELNLNLEAMVWKICFKDQEISKGGGKDLKWVETDGQLLKWTIFYFLLFKCKYFVLPLIFILYFAFHSVHYALGSVACANWK